MIDVLILDELERQRALTNKTAIQSVDFDVIFRGGAGTNTPGQFMLANDPAAFPSGTPPEHPGYAFSGYQSRVRDATFSQQAGACRPYYAAILKRWFFSDTTPGMQGSTMWSYDPATGAFTAEDSTRKLTGVIEDPTGVIWAVSYDTTLFGLYRRTGNGTWTQVLAEKMYASAEGGILCWDDGTPYFRSETSQWFKPSGTSVIATASPAWSALTGRWLQSGITGKEVSGAYLYHSAANTLKAGGTITDLQLFKTGTAAVVASVPTEALEALSALPITQLNYLYSEWVKVADTNYWLHVIGVSEFQVNSSSGSILHKGENYFFVSMVNVSNGKSQYLGKFTFGPARRSEVTAGNNMLIGAIGASYGLPTMSPIMASITSGKLRLVFAGPMYFATAFNQAQTNFALLRANIDALITI